MMTSSNGNIFSVTGPLCREFTGYQWNTLKKASEAGIWCFLWSAPEQTVETPVILRCHRAHYEGNVMITGVQGYKAVHLPQRHRWCESVPQRQHLTRGSADSSNSLRMYIISHTICTRLWCAALFCGYITRSQQIHSFTHILQGYITGTRVVIVSQGHG